MNEQIMDVLNNMKKHQESYEEIRELVFTDRMRQKQYTPEEEQLVIDNFFKVKNNAIDSILKEEKVTFLEAVVFYRILFKSCKTPTRLIDVMNMVLDIMNIPVKELNTHLYSKYNLKISNYQKYIDIIINMQKK